MSETWQFRDIVVVFNETLGLYSVASLKSEEILLSHDLASCIAYFKALLDSDPTAIVG